MDHVYLDYAATTPVRDEVRRAMEPYLAETFGNPSSLHRAGREAREALDRAREKLADAIGAAPAEIVFVRGGTESDNLALLGWCGAQRALGRAPRLVVTAIEHHAVLGTADHAESTGLADVTKVAVGSNGCLDLDGLRRSAGADPSLVSVMWVNNETGLVLPMDAVAEVTRGSGAVLHSDAAQAIGKVPVDVRHVPVDLLSGTGHKVYGPKGSGFLYAREGTPLAPLLHGGGQERGLRPGTEDVAGAVGLATAVTLAVAERERSATRLMELRERLEGALTSRLDDIRVNGSGAERAPHVLSVGIGGVEDGAALLMGLDLEGVEVSGGSACASGSTKASHVMEALYGPEDRHATVRFSFGRDTTEADIHRAADATVTVVRRMRDA